MKKTVSLLTAGVLSISILGACSNSKESTGGKDDKVKLEFFSYKSEAIETYDKLIEKFEKENPNIDVEQAAPPEAVTVLKTRVAKRDIPDIMAIGGDVSYKDLAKAGVFTDLSDNKNLEKVQPSYIQMLKDISGLEEVYGIPFVANANAVIYNKAIFKELGIEVPQTWDEFIAAAEKIQKAGQIPFYFTLKDAWTTLPAFNVLAANTQGEDFYDELNKGNILAGERYKEAAEKLVQLLEFGHKDQKGVGYNEGNIAFANEKAAMYLQGIWAIPEIVKGNPNIELGVFPYPVTNKAGESKVVSGVDVQLAVASTSEHPEEAKKFIDFLMEEENAKLYVEEQNAFSAIKGIPQENPVLEGLKDSFEKGALVDFPDHYIPTGVSPEKTLQTLAQNKDVDAFLKRLQADWEKVQSRQ